MNLIEYLQQYGDVLTDESLAKHTTFRIGGPCDYFVYPKTVSYTHLDVYKRQGTPFDEETHIVTLTEKTRQDNARFFEGDINKVPTHAITMGIATIMKAKKILMVATGENKADAIKAMVEGEISTDCPASVLQNHKDVVVIVDEAAASKLSK